MRLTREEHYNATVQIENLRGGQGLPWLRGQGRRGAGNTPPAAGREGRRRQLVGTYQGHTKTAYINTVSRQAKTQDETQFV